MFHLVCLGWLLFRAETISQAGGMLWQLATVPGVTPLATTILGTMLLCAGPLLAYEAWVEARGRKEALLEIHWLPWRGWRTVCRVDVPVRPAAGRSDVHLFSVLIESFQKSHQTGCVLRGRMTQTLLTPETAKSTAESALEHVHELESRVARTHAEGCGGSGRACFALRSHAGLVRGGGCGCRAGVGGSCVSTRWP